MADPPFWLLYDCFSLALSACVHFAVRLCVEVGILISTLRSGSLAKRVGHSWCTSRAIEHLYSLLLFTAVDLESGGAWRVYYMS